MKPCFTADGWSGEWIPHCALLGLLIYLLNCPYLNPQVSSLLPFWFSLLSHCGRVSKQLGGWAAFGVKPPQMVSSYANIYIVDFRRLIHLPTQICTNVMRFKSQNRYQALATHGDFYRHWREKGAGRRQLIQPVFDNIPDGINLSLQSLLFPQLTWHTS